LKDFVVYRKVPFCACSFVRLLEFAEDELKCTHVIVYFSKDRPDRGIIAYDILLKVNCALTDVGCCPCRFLFTSSLYYF